MKNLVVDIGNTRIKSALFEGKTLLGEYPFDTLEEGLKLWKNVPFESCLVSSVKYSQEELEQILPFPFHYLNAETPIPVGNGYSTPKSLGLDRIAAGVGAWEIAGQGPVLAIDLGTCITFELIDDQEIYRGGAISPGLAMRAKAMNAFTARLPLVELSPKPTEILGDSTITCMQAGIWYGVEFEIIGQIEAYRRKFPEIRVFICGGDAQSFVSLAKDHIFVVPNLVLFGLNSILNHNVE